MKTVWETTMTLDEAIAHLGADHVAYCLANPGHLEVLTSGAWLCNNGRSFVAYTAVTRELERGRS